MEHKPHHLLVEYAPIGWLVDAFRTLLSVGLMTHGIIGERMMMRSAVPEGSGSGDWRTTAGVWTARRGRGCRLPSSFILPFPIGRWHDKRQTSAIGWTAVMVGSLFYVQKASFAVVRFSASVEKSHNLEVDIPC